eukprot:1526978-Rhodomonas_salina.1
MRRRRRLSDGEVLILLGFAAVVKTVSGVSRLRALGARALAVASAFHAAASQACATAPELSAAVVLDLGKNFRDLASGLPLGRADIGGGQARSRAGHLLYTGLHFGGWMGAGEWE